MSALEEIDWVVARGFGRGRGDEEILGRAGAEERLVGSHGIQTDGRGWGFLVALVRGIEALEVPPFFTVIKTS